MPEEMFSHYQNSMAVTYMENTYSSHTGRTSILLWSALFDKCSMEYITFPYHTLPNALLKEAAVLQRNTYTLAF